jgi:hypothetical protein
MFHESVPHEVEEPDRDPEFFLNWTIPIASNRGGLGEALAFLFLFLPLFD